jgi:hypothetical protein
MRLSSFSLPAALSVALMLGGCDRLGFEDPAKIAAVREAEGKAVGAACRHAGRAIEDCYALNGKAPKSAVFAGWKEMNDYMRENKIDTVAPQLAAASSKSGKPATEGEESSTAAGDDKGKGKPAKAAEEEPKQSKAGAPKAGQG